MLMPFSADDYRTSSKLTTQHILSRVSTQTSSSTAWASSSTV